MSSPADVEPTLHLLNDVRYLYGQYLRFFSPVSATCEKLGYTLTSLRDGVRHFFVKYNTGDGPRAAFCQLTLGLCGTLITLKSGLSSCSRCFQSDSLATSDWPLALDSAWIEHNLEELSHISTMVEIINETMKLAQNESFGIRTSETVQEIHKRIDEARSSSSQLQTLMDSFFHGITLHTRIKNADGQNLRTFTSAKISHREVGQTLAAKFKQKTQDAISAKPRDEALLGWKLRHSVYWLSKSSGYLKEWRQQNELALNYGSFRASHTAWQDIARIFADALKAAWLLSDLGCFRGYEQPSFEMTEVVACAKKKVLGLLKAFYENVFTEPNYDLINELGNFDIRMADEQKSTVGVQHDGASSMPSPPSSDPDLISIGYTNASSPVELEAISPVSPFEAHPQYVPLELNPAPRLPCVNVPLKDVSNTGSTDVTCPANGLHITELEDPNVGQDVDDTPASFQEIELHNAEIQSPPGAWTGFTQNLFSTDSSPPHNTTYTRSRVRVFKLDSESRSYLSLNTYRESLTKDRRIIQPSTAQLVPLYAFADNRTDHSELYISDSGMQSSLRYKFRCRDADGKHYPWELYGFQGALMGAYFEGEYSAASVLLHRRGSLRTENERFPRIQVWTNFPPGFQGSTSTDPSVNPSESSPPLSMIAGRDFSALTNRLTANVNDSKIFIFSRNFIYVLFVSDRITLMRPRQGGFLHGKHRKKTHIQFVPNKDHGSSAIRVRTLKGTRSMPAGIPLDGAGMQHGDQERGELFEDFQSIEIEFDCEEDASEFVKHFKEYVEGWQQRCVPVDTFRALQRERRITVSSTTTFEGGKRRRTLQ